MGVSQERSSYVNDMRINYTQGSRQAELATVDGAVGGGGITGQHSVAGGCFHNPVLVWIYEQAEEERRDGINDTRSAELS